MPEFLEGTVDAPVIGRVKKVYILVPAGLAGAYVLYRWYAASRAADEGPAMSDGMYSTDDLSEFGESTTGGPTVVGGNNGNTNTDGTTPGAIDTNAEWTDAAVEKLTDSGYDPQTVNAALGEFLARRALDPAEATIVRAALARVGQPPEGRPWSVLEEAGAGTGTLPAPTGLRVGNAADTAIGFHWTPVPGAGFYRLYRDGTLTATASGTFTTATGLTANSSYSFAVSAVSTTGKESARSDAVIAKTRAPIGGIANRPAPTKTARRVAVPTKK